MTAFTVQVAVASHVVCTIFYMKWEQKTITEVFTALEKMKKAAPNKKYFWCVEH